MEAADYPEAITHAQAILSQPPLNTPVGFEPDLDEFADEQTTNGVWTAKSRKPRYSDLLLLGENLG